MLQYLFSFNGRINRAKLWLFVLINIVALIAIFAVMLGGMGAAGFNFTAPQTSNAAAMNLPVMMATCLAVLVLYIVMLWAGLAVTVKRLHDRNKGAVWLLAVFVLPLALDIAGMVLLGGPMAMHAVNGAAVAPSPLAAVCFGAASLIGLWWFIELYCLRGTVGENRFGPDPLA